MFLPREMNITQAVFHADCSLAPREKRILSRSINVEYRCETKRADRIRIDKKVREYCKQDPTTVRKGSIPTARFTLPMLHKKTPPPPSNSSFYLPNEIIYQILSHFTALDSQRSETDHSYREYCSLCYLNILYSCCLISKSWNGAATVTLYNKLKLDLDGTCEYHCRGIPWGDGVFWWSRRVPYLRDRYLKPLIRTLTAKPELAQYFRTVEIDLHHHLPDDYKVLPLYTKLISLCPNLTSITGDPCIFFVPVDLYLESIYLDFFNYISRGRLHKSRQAITLQRQKKLWKALSEHTAWESWEWTPQCQRIQLPAFHRFHYNWKSLKHLSIKGLNYEPGNSPSEIATNPIACLDALESLSLSNTGLRILQSVPMNKLTALSIELFNSVISTTTFREDLTELWGYLSRCSGVTSRLQKFSISTIGRHASLTERWLPKTMSLAPNLTELSISFPYTVRNSSIVLFNDISLAISAQWVATFPKCSKLRKISYLCPGWSHNKLLLKALSVDGVFPALREIEYYSSTAIVERSGLQTVDEASRGSKEQGESVDSGLEVELVGKRNFGRVLGKSLDSRKVHLKIS